MFSFKGVSFPAEFNVFSEFSQVGRICPSGVEDFAVKEQLWTQLLKEAQLMPREGDGAFCKNSYLRLMLPDSFKSSA